MGIGRPFEDKREKKKSQISLQNKNSIKSINLRIEYPKFKDKI